MNPYTHGPGRAVALARRAGWRLPLALLATTLALALPLWLATVGAALMPTLQRLTAQAEATVFAAPGTASAELRSLQAKLAEIPGVTAVQPLPRDAALAELAQRAALAGAVAELKANPLPDAFAVRFAARDAAAAVESLRQLARVDAVQFDGGWVGTLAAARRAALVIGTAAAALLLLSALLLCGYALRAVVRDDTTELRVLALLGARPGLAAAGGAWLGASVLGAAALLAIGVGEALRSASDPALRELALATGSNLTVARLPESVLGVFVAGAALAGALLGAWSGRTSAQ